MSDPTPSPVSGSPEPDSPPFDSITFRNVMGSFATGVTIVTGAGPQGPAGLAANSFTSVSLDPPLVLVCMAHTSSTWPAIRDSGAFCVNFLGEEGEEVCRRFGKKGVDRFAGTEWKAGVTGSPVLAEAIAYADCRVDAEHTAGDHMVVIGRVVDIGHQEGSRPLVFYKGAYGRLAP